MKNKYFIDIITVDRYTLYKGSDRVTINELMKEKNITKYRLSKNSGIPYTTINDICNGKALLEKCTAETIYRIAKTLGVTMEDLLEPYISEQIDFGHSDASPIHNVNPGIVTKMFTQTKMRLNRIQSVRNRFTYD